MDPTVQEKLDSIYFKFFLSEQKARQLKETAEEELVAQGERRAYGKILTVLRDLR